MKRRDFISLAVLGTMGLLVNTKTTVSVVHGQPKKSSVEFGHYYSKWKYADFKGTFNTIENGVLK